MRPVLVLQNQTADDPAWLKTWLDQHSVDHDIIDAGTCARFPSSMRPYSALAVMGGSMSANDPLLSNREAEVLILQAMHWDLPVIGHCLGGQLMSRALGAPVEAAAQPEIGWQPITWETSPQSIEWFGGNPVPCVMQWHYDQFGLPPGATRLASSDACVNQAWSMGPHLAMQFHIEIDEIKAKSWSQDPDPMWVPAQELYETVDTAQDILSGIVEHLPLHKITADRVYRRWLSSSIWAEHLYLKQ